jgi:heme/copper-type cytochrome/quinol oxidase subunit 4
MLQRVRRFAIDLHADESGPNTVEWVLLIIVALIVLVGIYWFINTYVFPKVKEGGEEMQGMEFEEP